MHGLDVGSTLHRQRSDRRDTITAVSSKGFQIRSDAGAAGRIESGDSQKQRRRRIGVISHLSFLILGDRNRDRETIRSWVRNFKSARQNSRLAKIADAFFAKQPKNAPATANVRGQYALRKKNFVKM